MISLSRVAARANSSRATLPHTSTTSISAKTWVSARSKPPSPVIDIPNICAYGITWGCRCWCVSGSSPAARRPSAASSACASSSVAPGASRPKMVMPGPRRGASGSTPGRNGVHASCATGNVKPSGITPTTVAYASPSCTVCPTIAESPAKRARHTSWPRTTTGGASARSSAGTRARPSSGGVAATRNPDAVIAATCTGRASPSRPMRLRVTSSHAPTSVTDRIAWRQTTKSCSARGSGSLACTSQFRRCTMRSPSGSGSVGLTNSITISKTTTPTQMANAIASPPTIVSPGYLTSIRPPSLRSSVSPPSHAQPPRVPARLPVLLHPAERDRRLPARLRGVQAPLAPEPLGFHVHVEAHLLAHLRPELVGSPQPAPERPRPREQSLHAQISWGVVRSASAMASASRFQLATSSPRRARPAGVRR